MKILTDSSAALPKELAEKYNIDIIPIKISWEEEGIDGVIEGAELFKRMRAAKGKTAPKTSQPSIGVCKTYFEKALKKSDEVLCITISSGASGTYNSAMQAKKFLGKDADKIHIIDSYQVDGSQSLMVLKAQELKEKGIDIKKIVTELENFKKSLMLLGFVENPEWLEKSGRLTPTKAKIVTQLQKLGIRPLIGVKKGKVAPISLNLKAKNKIEGIIKELEERVGDKEAVMIISHADSIKEVNKLEEDIRKKFPKIKILFSVDMNPIIGAHAGPGTIICSYSL